LILHTAVNPVGCPSSASSSDVLSSGQLCYELKRTGKPWREAKSDCESTNGTMLTIENQAEQDFVYHMLETLSFYSAIWLGLQDLSGEENWRWVTGAHEILKY